MVIAVEAVRQICFLNSKNTDKYADVIAAIELHFKPYEDEDSSIILFRQIVQRPGENIEAYIIRLRHAAVGCKFDADRLKQELKIQLMIGAQSRRVKEKARTQKMT